MPATCQLQEAASTRPPEIRRVIGSFSSDTGPTLIAAGSIHGNEPAGRLALERVAKRLAPISSKLTGSVLFVTGNTAASTVGSRFIDSDLNRLWTRENIRANSVRPRRGASEGIEQHELLSIFRTQLGRPPGEVYVLDLHTTSAGGAPFATLGDTMRNRSFARSLPVTILLGIEEQLSGTMLEFLNNEGAVTLGFEAGQHTDPVSIANHEAIVVLALVKTGILASSDVPDLEELSTRLRRATGASGIFEVRHREPVAEGDRFEMLPDFKNFDPIDRGQVLAMNRSGQIAAPESGLIMMPLYQNQGEDGFFVVRRVAPFWLWLSAMLRRLRAADLVHLLPGVRRFPRSPERLRVNTRVARFFPVQIFHLLGFRRLSWKRHFLVVSRRRFDTISPFGKEDGNGR